MRDGVGEAWARPRGRSATGDFRAFHRRAHRTHYTTRGSVRDVLLMVGRDAHGEATVFLAWVEETVAVAPTAPGARHEEEPVLGSFN